MRLFLGFLLFDTIFRSIAALTPYREWCKELNIRHYPYGLPDPEEREQLARKRADADHDLVTERVMQSFDSLWDYFKPWPEAQSRKKMYGPGDAGKFAYCWMTTRLGFCENLVFAPQRWTMFSPNVGSWDPVVRARLVYQDGTRESQRTIAEPSDLAHHDNWRFLSEKWLQVTTKLQSDDDSRRGYCNLLAHRHPRNEAGSPLVKIELIELRYDYPPPDEDARAFLDRQKVPLGKETIAPFYEYDVASRKGRKLP